jgi:hypothetical protein
MLTLLTATGARPKAWSICERLMAAQDYAGPVRWVIVDDGDPCQPVTFVRDGWELDVTHPGPLWSPGQNTQARNLLHGLSRIHEDARVVVIEDDDWYAQDWLTHVSGELGKAELVGEMRARYYSASLRRGRQLKNTGHASLCATAMRGSALETFREACRNSPKFIDLELWKCHPSKHLFDGHRVVGIKGLPGRGGIGMGHRDDFIGTKDPDGSLLREWVGGDAEMYL